MQNNAQSLLAVRRENYIVPKGEEQVVHYKIAKVADNGTFIEKPRLVKTNVKFFESSVKKNLEVMGYKVEILFHPNGTYSNVVIKDIHAEVAEKDAEIARLKALLEAKENTEVKEEANENAEVKTEAKKGGRPRKEA